MYRFCIYSNEKFIQISRFASNSWLGFVNSPPRYCKVFFTLSQQYSKMFMSGIWTGHTMPWIVFSYLYLSTIRTRWTGALSSWNRYKSLGKWRAITGHIWLSCISIYFTVFILHLLYILKIPEPCHVIHPHIITETLGLHDSADMLSGWYAPWADLQTYTRLFWPMIITKYYVFPIIIYNFHLLFCKYQAICFFQFTSFTTMRFHTNATASVV